MTHTLESLMRPILEFAEEWKRCGHLQHKTLPTWAALESALAALVQPQEQVDIVFDGPPSHESGRFVEVESPPGKSIRFGEWVERDGGLWALRFNMPSLVQPQEPFLWARVLIATGELDDCGDCVAGKAEDLQADESDGTKAIPLYAAPAAQVERGEPATFNPLTCQLSASDFPGPKQREEWEAAPAAQEAQPACDNRGSSYHVDGDPIARGEAPEPVAQPNIEAMVDRFLCWPLPKDFAPDCGIGFKQIAGYDGTLGSWPIGTNLFTADQARQMFEHALAGQPAQHKEQE